MKRPVLVVGCAAVLALSGCSSSGSSAAPAPSGGAPSASPTGGSAAGGSAPSSAAGQPGGQQSTGQQPTGQQPTGQQPTGQPGTRDAASVVRTTADKTGEAGSAKVSLQQETDLAGRTLRITADGAFDHARKRGELALSLPLGASRGASTARIREIVAGGRIYIKGIPGAPAGKWVAVDTAQATGLSLDSSTTDPASAVDVLRGASDDVREVETSTVRGEQTTHYTGTYDLRKAVAASPSAQRQRMERLLAQVKVSKVPFDLYVDAQGRTRRLEQKLTVTVRGSTATTDQTLELYDYGTSVDVSVPPASQVVKLPGSAAARA